MVKFTTENKVYAVARGGTLRWIETEDAARAFYGADWNTKVDDIADVFYTNYVFGPHILTAADYSVTAEQSAATSIDANL